MDKKHFDNKTIIINLLKERKERSVSIKQIIELNSFIFYSLLKQKKINEYKIAFDINYYSIDRTLQYNNDIIELGVDGESIRLRKTQNLDVLVEKYKVDETISQIIKDFIKK